MEKPYKEFLSITVPQWIAGSLLVLVCAVVLILGNHAVQKKTAPIADSFPKTFALVPKALKAEAAIVYDLTTGRVLFSKNEEEQLPLASLTKLMTADTALDTMSPTSSIRISPRAVATEGESGIKAGSVWSVGALIKYALLVSSNDAIAAVAESGGAEFMTAMNNKAKTLGLSQSYYLDPTGLDVTRSVSGGYGSALDMSKLAGDFYMNHPSFFEGTVGGPSSYSGSDNSVHGTATASPILDIPGLIGVKTGYTDLAGGNIVAVFDLSVGHPVVAVVLHSTQAGRFEDVRTLINSAREAQSQQ